MAFLILSSGPLSASRLRTVDARVLGVAAALLLLVTMAGCVALGYRWALSAQASVADPRVPRAASAVVDLRRPEGRMLVERIATLSGRLSRVEGAAGQLAARLGLASAPADAPSGGPLVSLAGSLGAGAADLAKVDLVHEDIARLEDAVELVEGELQRLDDASLERELARMAFPSHTPVPGHRISSNYGVRRDPFTGRLARHTGMDIPAPTGTPVLASAGGRVVKAGPLGAYGNAVVIDHGNGLSTLYGHASRLHVRVGDLVLPRQRIASVGSTGRSTGPHLHFEVLRHGVRVSPREYLAQAARAEH